MLRSQSISNFAERSGGLFSFKRKTLRGSASLQSLNTQEPKLSKDTHDSKKSMDQTNKPTVATNTYTTSKQNNTSKVGSTIRKSRSFAVLRERPESLYEPSTTSEHIMYSEPSQLRERIPRSSRGVNLANRRSMIIPLRSSSREEDTIENSTPTSESFPSPTLDTSSVSPETMNSFDSLLDQTSIQFYDFEMDIDHNDGKRISSSIKSDLARKLLELEQLEQFKLAGLLREEGSFKSDISIIGNAVLVTTTEGSEGVEDKINQIDYSKALMEEDYNMVIEV